MRKRRNLGRVPELFQSPEVAIAQDLMIPGVTSDMVQGTYGLILAGCRGDENAMVISGP
jgi:hypothetical protein